MDSSHSGDVRFVDSSVGEFCGVFGPDAVDAGGASDGADGTSDGADVHRETIGARYRR